LGADAVRFEHLNFVTPQEVERQQAVWDALGAPDASVSAYVREPPTGIDFPAAVERLAAKQSKIPVFVKPNLGPQERLGWYSDKGAPGRTCVYPWRSLFVGANGDAYPCLFMLRKVGNLVEQPLAEIWNGEPMVAFRQELKHDLFPACVRCCKL
jgi:hypothetical protein